MQALLWREFKECMRPTRLGYHLLTVVFMGFILWNFGSKITFFSKVYGDGFFRVVLLMPSYFALFFAMMLVKNFMLDKKLGILEAILATGVDKISLAISRTISILVVSVLQTTLVLLFVEMLLRENLGVSLLSFYKFPDDWLLFGLLAMLAVAFIWALTAIVLVYSVISNYLLLLAFFLMFLYVAFYYLLAGVAMWLCVIFFAAIIVSLLIATSRFLNQVDNDLVIGE